MIHLSIISVIIFCPFVNGSYSLCDVGVFESINVECLRGIMPAGSECLQAVKYEMQDLSPGPEKRFLSISVCFRVNQQNILINLVTFQRFNFENY